LTPKAHGVSTAQSSACESAGYFHHTREWDTVVGLQYNRARYYDPYTGNWINEDPLGFVAGVSDLYGYVHNDPTNRIDTSGLFQQDEDSSFKYDPNAPILPPDYFVQPTDPTQSPLFSNFQRHASKVLSFSASYKPIQMIVQNEVVKFVILINATFAPRSIDLNDSTIYDPKLDGFQQLVFGAATIGDYATGDVPALEDLHEQYRNDPQVPTSFRTLDFPGIRNAKPGDAILYTYCFTQFITDTADNNRPIAKLGPHGVVARGIFPDINFYGTDSAELDLAHPQG
jgi:RHS repeat-associated protein